MTDKLQKRFHDAFDGVRVPDELAMRTLAAIEASRPMHEGSQESSRDGSGSEILDLTTGMTRRVARRFSSVRGPIYRRALTALAACLVLVIFGFTGVAWASQPYAFVTIDVNPSLELGINRFDRVASVVAFNADGEQVLDDVDVEGMTYEEALIALRHEFQPYLSEEASVDVTISCDDDANAERFEQIGRHCLGSDGANRVHCSRADTEECHAAREAGLGANRYRLYQEVLSQGVEITLEEARTMSASELRALIAGDAGYTDARGANAGSRRHEADEDGKRGAGEGHRGGERRREALG